MPTGAVSIADLVTVTTAQTIRGAKYFANAVGFTPKETQTLAATNAIVVSDAAMVRVAGSGGAVTLTSEPTIADGFDGQMVVIRGTHDTNTVLIQDVANLAGSNVDLGGADRTLGAGDYLVLLFNADSGNWEELVFKNN